ncbi:MAG: glycosyltransferase family 2 protein [Candidatus Omnitrophica bacterium]|nr:glycosyltransferase family 2 protein [Candidatus Omnitrophota bacterium]
MKESFTSSLAAQGVSIIIPVYNEADGIQSFLADMKSFVDAVESPTEVVVVNDGSTDATADLLCAAPFSVIHHEGNRGYGAAIKTGLENSRYEAVVIIDADGTYPPKEIFRLCECLDQCDMVVGARTGPDAHIPWPRRPAKWLIRLFASWMVRRSIPDLNSGLRAVRRSQTAPLIRLLPDGFSLTTTITIAFSSTGKRVRYLPIQYLKRTGKSKFHPVTDTWNMILLILRTVVLLRPLNVFLPFSFALAFLGLGVGFYSKFFTGQFMDATFIVLMMASVQMFVLGLIADLIVRINLWTH